MARIAGIDLPPKKNVAIGLTAIYGVGRARALDVLSKAEVDRSIKVMDLTEDEARRIRKIITDEGGVEGDLRKEVSTHVRRLMEIGCYRGVLRIRVPLRRARNVLSSGNADQLEGLRRREKRVEPGGHLQGGHPVL